MWACRLKPFRTGAVLLQRQTDPAPDCRSPRLGGECGLVGGNPFAPRRSGVPAVLLQQRRSGVPTALLPDRGQPLSVGGILAIDQIEVGLLQFLGSRPAAADTYLTAVHFANRGNLGGGAGEEGLVGDVHLITGDALLDHRN